MLERICSTSRYKTKEKKSSFGVALLTLYVISIYLFSYSADTFFVTNIAFVLFGCYAIKQLIEEKTILLGTSTWLIASFVALAFASTLWSLDFDLALGKSRTLFLLFVQVFLVYQTYIKTGSVENIIRAFLIAGLCLSIYAVFWEYGPSYLIEAVLSRQRLGVEISQENVFGMQAATTTVLCFFYAIFKNKKLFYLISILPILLCAASGSRKAVIMVVLGIIFLLYFRTKGIKQKLIFLGQLALIAAISYPILQMPLFEYVGSRIENIFVFLQGGSVNEGSLYARQSFIEIGWEGFLQRPIFGHGMDSFRVYLASITGRSTYAHNNYIELLFNVGIIGTCLYYGMFIYILLNLMTPLRKKDTTAVIVVTILVIQLAVDLAAVSYYSKVTYLYLTCGFLCVRQCKMGSQQARA